MFSLRRRIKRSHSHRNQAKSNAHDKTMQQHLHNFLCNFGFFSVFPCSKWKINEETTSVHPSIFMCCPFAFHNIKSSWSLHRTQHGTKSVRSGLLFFGFFRSAGGGPVAHFTMFGLVTVVLLWLAVTVHQTGCDFEAVNVKVVANLLAHWYGEQQHVCCAKNL